MLWPKKNSYEEFDNEKKFLWHQPPPPPNPTLPTLVPHNLYVIGD